ASKQGVSRKKLAISSLLEAVLQLIVVTAVSLVMLMFDRRLEAVGQIYKVGSVTLLLVFAILLMPSVFNRLVSNVHRLLRSDVLEEEHLVDAVTIVRSSFLYVLGTLVVG